jgi:hypothetical protein
MLDETTATYAEGFDAGERQAFADRTNERRGLPLHQASTEWQRGFHDGYRPRTRRWAQGWRDTSGALVSSCQRADAVGSPELTGANT